MNDRIWKEERETLGFGRDRKVQWARRTFISAVNDRIWKEEGEALGFGRDRKVQWARRTFTSYARLRAGKGSLRVWQADTGGGADNLCRRCGLAEESGDHLGFSTAPPDNLRPLGNLKGEEGRRFWKTFEDVEMGEERSDWGLEDSGG